MRKVIVFGSLNMDLSIESDRLPLEGETMFGRNFIVNAGGKGANQAVAAAKMGAEVHMVGAVGGDLFGDHLIASLAETGVGCEYVTRCENVATGVAVIIRCKGDNRIILGAGANLYPTAHDAACAIEELAQPEDIFLTQLECDFDETLGALRYAHEKDLYTVINPAPACELPAEIYHSIDMLVVNETECELLTGIYPADENACRRALQLFCDRGVETAIITLGERGSILQSSGQTLVSIPPTVNAVDTTCAGDTYIGAMVAAHTRACSLDEAMELATNASALTTTTVGAQQSIPHLEDVPRPQCFV